MTGQKYRDLSEFPNYQHKISSSDKEVFLVMCPYSNVLYKKSLLPSFFVFLQAVSSIEEFLII